jgi:glycosyltransferase involved in cell wall biosynthesis
MSSVFLSVVVPCFNESDGIYELHRRVSAVCKAQVGDSYEFVLVNDGSADGTWGAMKEISKRDKHVVAVDLSRNHGHQLALSAGLSVCRGQRVFILDADLQDPPELLPKMMARMDDGCDVVYGQRIKREGETVFKKATAFLFYRLLNRMVDVEIPKDTGDFRLLSRRALDVLNSMPEQHRFIRGMVSWVGFRQDALPYERAARFAGETKYPLSKMIRFAVDAITSFSIKPLRIATVLGLLVSAGSILMALFVMYGFYQGGTITGWASTMTVILFLGGVQLFVMGVLGEYLGRMFIQSKGRPLFIIRDVSRGDDHGT